MTSNIYMSTCSLCRKRPSIVYSRASGEKLCARCLIKRVEKGVMKALREEAKRKRKFAVLGLESTETIVIICIVSRKIKNTSFVVIEYEKNPLISWITARYRIETVPSVDDSFVQILPFSLESASVTFLRSLIKLRLNFLTLKYILPLAKFPRKHIETYAALNKLPIVPFRTSFKKIEKLLAEIEQTTPTIRYQFLTSIENIKSNVSL